MFQLEIMFFVWLHSGRHRVFINKSFVCGGCLLFTLKSCSHVEDTVYLEILLAVNLAKVTYITSATPPYALGSLPHFGTSQSS